jgi:hypothetical protein
LTIGKIGKKGRKYIFADPQRNAVHSVDPGRVTTDSPRVVIDYIEEKEVKREIKEIADHCEVVPGLPPEEIVQRYFDKEIIWSLERTGWEQLTPIQKHIVASAILSIEQETIS